MSKAIVTDPITTPQANSINTPKRAGIYTRVSTGRQEEEGTSLDTQEERCRAFALVQGYTIDTAHVYREVYTGTELWNRPRLTALREAIRHHLVTHVIVYAIDRLSRDPVHLGVILSEAEHHGVDVEFVTEPFDQSPEGQLIRFVRGYAARVESEKIRERSLRGRRARVSNGKIHGQGIELYGYRRDKDRGIREVYTPEAAVVRDIFGWYVEERLSVNAIVKRLYERGIPSPASGKVFYADAERQSQWGKGQIHRMLKHPAYKGETITWRFQNNGKLRPASEWIYLPEGTTPALVPLDLWNAAHARLATNLGADARNRTRAYLLRGMVRCAVCQRPMHAMTEHQRYRVYRCASRERLGVGPCGGKRAPADALEAWAWDQIVELVQEPQRLKAALQRQQEMGPDTTLLADIEATRRRLGILARKQAELLHAFREDEHYPADVLRREVLAIEKEKSQLQTTLTEKEAQLAAAQATREQVETFVTYCQRIQTNLIHMEWPQKRRMFETFQITVFANGGNPHDWRMRVHGIDAPELQFYPHRVAARVSG